MTLLSQQYLANPIDPEVQAETGWPGVQKSIHLIVVGHLVIVAAALLFVFILVIAGTTAAEPPEGAKAAKLAHKVEKVTEALVVVLIGTAICGFMALGGYIAILRGEWGCLMRAPERCYAKWYMFAAVTCLLISPVSGFVTGFLIGTGPPPPAVEELQKRFQENPKEASRWLEENQDEFFEAITRPYIYVRAISGLIGLLSNIFFVLFLRAVSNCWEDDARRQLVDLYLLFTGLLGVAPIFIGLTAPHLLTNVAVLLALGGGAVIDFLWYLFVLISTSAGISEGMERQAAALAAARLAAR